jgi:hypothetical protein
MNDRRIAVALFLLTFVTYAWFFGGGGWNQNAQFDLSRALVERQTLHIDGYRVNTGDVSWSPTGGEWHAYINKPPGVSFLGAIPYALIYTIERALHVPIDSWKWMTINAYLVTVLTCGVTGAFIPVVLYLYGVRRVSRLASLGVALAIAFGTIVFPFSTTMFAHVPAALFLLLAFVWLDERPVLAGICAGIAGVVFYICIPAAAVLFIGAWRRGGLKPALRFLLGGIPFGIALGLYHWVCFGSPFVTAVETSTGFTEQGLLFGVFRLPSMRALWALLFSSYRGLFFFCPVLAMSVAGAIAMLHRRVMRREVAMIAAICAIFLLSIASFNGWHGGGAYGPRYILPIIPLMGVPMLFVRGRRLAIAAVLLGVFSFVFQLAGAAVDPAPYASFYHPIEDIALPGLFGGKVSINPQTVDELTPNRNYPKGSYESLWASFNLGELVFGAGSPLSVLPMAAWVIGGSALLWRRVRVMDA